MPAVESMNSEKDWRILSLHQWKPIQRAGHSFRPPREVRSRVATRFCCSEEWTAARTVPSGDVTLVALTKAGVAESATTVSPIALGVIARAVAIASKARDNFFMFPPRDRFPRRSQNTTTGTEIWPTPGGVGHRHSWSADFNVRNKPSFRQAVFGILPGRFLMCF